MKIKIPASERLVEIEIEGEAIETLDFGIKVLGININRYTAQRAIILSNNEVLSQIIVFNNRDDCIKYNQQNRDFNRSRIEKRVIFNGG